MVLFRKKDGFKTLLSTEIKKRKKRRKKREEKKERVREKRRKKYVPPNKIKIHYMFNIVNIDFAAAAESCFHWPQKWLTQFCSAEKKIVFKCYYQLKWRKDTNPTHPPPPPKKKKKKERERGRRRKKLGSTYLFFIYLKVWHCQWGCCCWRKEKEEQKFGPTEQRTSSLSVT